MLRRRRGIAALWIGAVLPAATAGAAPEGYFDQAALEAALRELASSSPMCVVDVLATTAGDHPVHVLTLASDPGTAADRPALLITAGIDGRHLVGTETAVRVAGRIVADHPEVLETMTIYVVPRVNPDGAAAMFAAPLRDHAGNMRPVDDDRDGVADEDGPLDLNGDGLVTMMRRLDPPLDDAPTHVADPAEPRLLKEAEPAKGEGATYVVYVEGLDQDDDGRIAEDGPGMVDLDHNFMHEWPEYDATSGAYQLSEPESNALAQFVLDHRNIVAALTYGRHDNLVNVPDGKGTDVSGRGPKVIDRADVELYESIGELFEETTGQTRAPKRDVAGSFHSWLYAHRGLPSFATVVWGRPDSPKPDADADGEAESADESGESEQTPDDQRAMLSVAGVWEGTATIAEVGEVPFTVTLEQDDDGGVTGMFASQMFAFDVAGGIDEAAAQVTLSGGVGESTVEFTMQVDGDVMTGSAAVSDGQSIDLTVERVADDGGDGGSKRGGDQGDKPADPEAAAWLEYLDGQRDGAGFVAWTPFDHPTLGSVEIGGFVPGVRMNPPAGELDELAEKQTAFVVELVGRQPALAFVGPEVDALADGLYDVRFGIVNDGTLPTSTAMARKARAVPPIIVRLSIEPDAIVSGDRVSRAWGVDGGGGRFTGHWIVRAASPEAITIDVESVQFGNHRLPAQEASP